MSFNGIYGQRYIVEGLIKTVKESNITHSYIFEGPRGIGKRTIAKIFAKMLLCETPLASPCEECKACVLCNTNNHPDLKIIEGDKSISVEQIREIAGDVGIKPYYGGKKVYIITKADKMTIQAQNSLLKTLEEPPEYVVIILLTESINALLATVISRCVIKKFAPNTKDEIKKYIKDKHPNVDRAELLVELSGGVIGKVEELLKNDELMVLRGSIFEILKKILEGTMLESIETNEFFVQNKDNVDLVFNFMLLYLRDILILKETCDKGLVINVDYLDALMNLAKAKNSILLQNGIKAVLEAKLNLESNANFNSSIEAMILKMRKEF